MEEKVLGGSKEKVWEGRQRGEAGEEEEGG